MSKPGPRAEVVNEALQAIKDCVGAFSALRTEEDWYWHKNVTAKGADKKKPEPNCMLSSIEAIWMFLKASKLKATAGLETMIPSEVLIQDIASVFKIASSGFPADPYLPVKVRKTDFVETAGRFLSCIAEITANGYLMAAIDKHDAGVGIIEGMMPAVRKAVKMIVGAAYEAKPRCLSWAATEAAIYRKDADSPTNDLTHPYFTLCALSGLHDILRKSGPAVDLQAQERIEILDAIKGGISGLNLLYRDDSQLFVDNLSYQKDDVIPTVFAIEAILRVWNEIEISALRSNTRSAITRLVSEIGADLRGLRLFDRDADFKFQAELVPSGKVAVGLDDHTTLGSISNVLCLGLDRMPLTGVTDTYYQVMDGCVASVLGRRDKKHKTWKDQQTSIWYSSRAVESLAMYVSRRPIKERTVTARQLVGLIQNAIQSETVQEAIAAFARRAVDEDAVDVGENK